MSATDDKVNVSIEQVKVAVTNGESECIFFSPECPVRKVTVYADRAEVCRVMHAKAKKGINEILLKKLPQSIFSDSIRVEGIGNATIEEVSYQTKYVTKDEEELNKNAKELQEAQDILLREKENIGSELAIVKKQWDILNDFAKRASNAKQGETTDLNENYFNGISKFLKLYKAEGGSLEESRLKLERMLLETNEKLNANVKNQLGKNSTSESRECTIVIDAATETPVELVVSYVVSSATWIPSYDIRMFTTEGVMKIMYYGQIQQSTGEDWNEAKLFLSTASPSVGGTLPELESVVLSLKEKYQSFSKRSSRMSYLSRAAVQEECFGDGDQQLNLCLSASCAPPPPPPSLRTSKAKVANSTTSTSYEIARPATIPSDNIQHKVSVGIIDLKPNLEYIAVPKKVPRAFLTAKLTNTSPYSFLPGSTSIFLDNSFVAKASMNSVSPQEEFECSLGVDPSIRITYKPLKKFQETTGFISKTKNVMCEQSIEVKNTHDYHVKITVKDNLPRSDVDKIKVNLVEPQIDMKHPEKQKYVRMNKHNHVEWDLGLEKQETKTITLKYSMEYPPSEEIEFHERSIEN